MFVLAKVFPDGSGFMPLCWDEVATDLLAAKIAADDCYLRIYEIPKWPTVPDWRDVKEWQP